MDNLRTRGPTLFPDEIPYHRGINCTDTIITCYCCSPLSPSASGLLLTGSGTSGC